MTGQLNIYYAIKELDILEGFLSELLRTDVIIESLLNRRAIKKPRRQVQCVDLLVRTREQEQIIIEVQATMEWGLPQSPVIRNSKAITEYIQAGQPYRHIRKDHFL